MTLPLAPATDIALELERLRGTVAQGFAQVDTKFAEMAGGMALVVERTGRMDAEVTALEVRVRALEKRVWTASGGATLIGMAATFIFQVLAQ
ncbi:hypothetical protein ACFWA4_05855 [Streptomyces sp. NPDC060011]|uniref:hypothetical protein n=1 Tax=Streptomyces sp. NPDC060011 TaxID=3347037 RepID=UPI0036C740E6